MDETRLADQDQINTSMSPEQVREPINIFERRSDLFQITLIVYAYFCVFDSQLNRRVLLYYEDDNGYFTFFDVKSMYILHICIFCLRKLFNAILLYTYVDIVLWIKILSLSLSLSLFETVGTLNCL